MSDYIKKFIDFEDEGFRNAGGKGRVLAELFQAGYPVPDGFIIFPAAFDGKTLKQTAWDEIKGLIDAMQRNNPGVSFAVRSSALAEDSSFASFAGEFETVLDVHTDDAVRAAIQQVRMSTESDRVKAYGKAKGISISDQIAIVVQELVRADYSGIFFTMDPVANNRFEMQGNYIYGLGEDLVGGEAEPYTFTISYPKGTYKGPKEFKKYAKKLFTLANQLEERYGTPQDIEYAVSGSKLFILQSRPITNLQPYDRQNGEWNISRMGDYVWVEQEVFPDVMTPATWSIFKNFQNMNLYRIPIMGNIHGRFYMNFSLAFKMFALMNKSDEYMYDYVMLTTGHDLSNVTVNPLPLTYGQILKAMLPKMVTMLPKQAALVRKFDSIIAENPQLCEETSSDIRVISDPEKLAAMYADRIFPLFWNLLQVQDKANEDYFYPYMAAKQSLIKLLGDEKAKTLLSMMTGSSNNLASIQSLVELQKLDQGLTTREAYAKIAGHRPEKENEVAEARLYEQEGWIEERLREYRKTKIDYLGMAEKRKHEFDSAWEEFDQAYPKQAKSIKKKIDKTLNAMEKREIIRSELTRSLGVIRNWYLRAAVLMGLRTEDVFFLETDELIQLLKGEREILNDIEPRKAAYQRQKTYPIYPFVISGRFDLDEWLADENRRSDFYDSHAEVQITDEVGIIRGQAGSAGQVTAKVRIIHSPSEGHLLKDGEVLVASTTNVGWTPLFPRAAAVITDVGAPLSHAAIIARELGIPAVVGTSNATMRLQTGDTVTVDGTKGIVYIQ